MDHDGITVILDSPPPESGGLTLGSSRDGRSLNAYRFGRGSAKVSLIAGCHGDEPVGPRLLRHLVGCLERLPAHHPWLEELEWWIVPHANPDGEARNQAWSSGGGPALDPGLYLRHVARERPGDDIEFGFPRHAADRGARPENQAIRDWWATQAEPFRLHCSLHGMAIAGGPWFLIDQAWQDRTLRLKESCREKTAELGYSLHDVERHGEKGFVRLGRGFCTRPDSRAMRRYFLDLGDEETAEKFRPSSMETIRGLGGDPLTLVSEIPLFITPGVGETLGPPDPVAQKWRERIQTWRLRLLRGEDSDSITTEAQALGLRPMPIRDQMILQWTLVAAGLDCVRDQPPSLL